MRYTPKERREAIDRAMSCGLSYQDAVSVRRIALTLHRWYELECGTEQGAIERDEETNKPYFYYDANIYGTWKRKRYKVADRETGALKRLKAIMAKYAPLTAYVQTDPRGGTIYLIRPGDIPEGSKVEECYSRGVFIA
jgi:hypothetical protein